MNVSGNNFANIARNGHDLSNTLSNMLLSNTILMVFYLLIGVSLNSLAVFVFFRANKIRKTACTSMLPITDLTACIVGTSFFIAISRNPVNMYGDSLCRFMLGINMLLANLSGLLTVDCSIGRLICLMCVFVSNKRLRKYRWYSIHICVAFAIAFSIPSFIFYGETDIVYTIQNISVSGKICGAARISVNATSVQAYPIVVLTIYAIEFIFICIVQIVLFYKISRNRGSALSVKRWQGIKFTISRKIESVKVVTNEKSKTIDYSKIIDMYADIDCSISKSDKLICSTCDDLKNETKRKNDERSFKSNYDLMIEPYICISDNTKSSYQTSAQPKYIKVKTTKTCLSCISCSVRTRYFKTVPRAVILLILFAVSTFPRAVIMILESNDKNFWNEMSTTEYTLFNFLYQGYLFKSAFHPFFYFMDPIKLLKDECRKHQS